MAKQRIAVVTGGMGGLGETISTKMADAGYRVVITYSPSNTKYKSWLEEMKSRSYAFSAYPVDAADYEDCARKCAQIGAECGPIDILVNNAGITRDMTFKKMSKSDWDAVMRTNLDSCFNMTKQVMDGMVDRGWGRVINVSSVNGQRARSARPTTRRPRPASTASPRRSRSRWRARASPSTPSRPATSAPRW